jgi:hypothetical protein
MPLAQQDGTLLGAVAIGLPLRSAAMTFCAQSSPS